MAFLTINDLRKDALELAQEENVAANPYYARALSYLDAVQDAVITGGSLLDRAELPLVDWKWALAEPRRTLLLVPKIESASITLALTAGSATGTFSANPFPTGSLVGYRLRVTDVDDRPKIITHAATSITLDHAWHAESVAPTTDWTAFKTEYALPADHVRMASGLLVQGRSGVELDFIDRAAFEDEFPWHLVTEGTLQAAMIQSEGLVRVSHYPAAPGLVVEYESIVRPASLEAAADPANDEPTIPAPYRRVLSTGAAMLLLLDKDDEKYLEIFSQFQAQWRALEKGTTRSRHTARGYGALKVRQDQRLGRVRYTAETGLPVLWW
jgi:hypothetical protein